MSLLLLPVSMVNQHLPIWSVQPAMAASGPRFLIITFGFKQAHAEEVLLSNLCQTSPAIDLRPILKKDIHSVQPDLHADVEVTGVEGIDRIC